jgi:hypothetical protein
MQCCIAVDASSAEEAIEIAKKTNLEEISGQHWNDPPEKDDIGETTEKKWSSLDMTFTRRIDMKRPGNAGPFHHLGRYLHHYVALFEKKWNPVPRSVINND